MFRGYYQCTALYIAGLLGMSVVLPRGVQYVYVSQTSGKDSPSCGPQSNPCKTIVMGVWRVQHDGQVYVDGTGSEINPYTCKSSVLELVGIHSNKSLAIIGVQSIPHVKCQEGHDIRLNQSLLDHNETTVQLTNLQFVNTSVSAQDINLYIDNCIFTGAAQAVNLVQSTKAVTLSFNNSLCTNISSCIVTSITQKLTPRNKISIALTNSNITASWYSFSQFTSDYSSGIHVTSTGEYEPGSITCHIELTNIYFEHNVLGVYGLILVDLENAFTSLYLDKVVFFESKTAVKMVSSISVLNSYNNDMILNDTKFVQNYHGSCGAIQVKTKNNSNLYILNSHFEKFNTEQDGLLILNSNHDSEVFIENTTFTSNHAIQTGGCLSLNGGQSARVTIKDSTFLNNSAGCAGVMWLHVKASILTTIQGCHFESNSANTSAGLGALLGNDVNIEIIDSTVIGTTAVHAGGVINIGLFRCVDSDEKVYNATLLFRNVKIIRSLMVAEYPLSYVGVAGILSYYGSITVQDSIIRDVGIVISSDLKQFFFQFYAKIYHDVPFNNYSQIGFYIKILNSTIENKSAKFANAENAFLFCNGLSELTLESVVIDLVGGLLFIDSKLDRSIDVKVDINNCVIKNSVPYGYGVEISLSAILSTLQITNTLFESNTASTGGCLYLYGAVYVVLLRNVTFKNCWTGGDGGAILLSHVGGEIIIESCKFLDNKSARGAGGAIAFDMPNSDKIIDPGCIKGQHGSVRHRVWSYNTSVTIKNTIFANNTAISGGALSLSSGKYTLQNCSFIDNFAKVQGGHIFVTSDSTSLQILNSSFLQQLSSKKVQILQENMTFYIGSFIDFQSAGPLRILNSKLESTSSQGLSNTLVTVSKANYVNFGENNQTILTCQRGSKLDILNFTTKINTEYKSRDCVIKMNVMKFICKPCGIGTYSLQRGQSLGLSLVSGVTCLPCPFGADCLNKISAKPNFWGYKVKENPPALNFILCPLGYCKQPDEHDFDDYNSCHGNRNGSLCGKCKKGFTETLLSPSCRREYECQDTWLWAVAVAMVLLMALYLIHKPRFSGMLKSHILWFKSNPSQDDEEDQSKDYDGGGYLKIVFYFYQVANILLITTSYNSIVESYLLQPVVGIFNFEFRLSSRGLLCPFVGLTSVTKQLLFACPVFGVLLMIAVCYGCHCLLHKCQSKSRPTLGPYLGAVLETLLLGYAVFANTALKLFRCTSIGGKTRLFIAGNVLCYEWWQYLLMVIVAVVVLPFIVTLGLGSRWLYKGSISIKEFFLGCVFPLPYLMYKLMSLLCGPREPRPEPPEWKASVTAVLYGPFRDPQDNTTGAIYWESILIFRRLVLIVIYVIVTDPLSKEFLLTLLCVVILLHHIIVRPFSSQAANMAEAVSLFGLVVIATINAFNASFLSTGLVPQGPLKSFALALNWIQVIILSILPVLCVLAVVAAIASQLIRLITKAWSFITCSCIRSRGWHVSDDEVRRLLVTSTWENYDT